MLVLSRKVSEGIRIGADIRIVVVKVERNGVRIGIEAPDHVGIVREELLTFDEEGSFDFDREESLIGPQFPAMGTPRTPTEWA